MPGPKDHVTTGGPVFSTDDFQSQDGSLKGFAVFNPAIDPMTSAYIFLERIPSVIGFGTKDGRIHFVKVLGSQVVPA
jgi:hypothetical protein